MTRQQVLDQCYFANSLEEVEKAFEARAQYLREDPYDSAVFEIGEMLAMLKQGFEVEGGLARLPARALNAS